MKPTVYLQAGFWKSLSANYSREGIRTKLDVSDALGDTCVITDVTEEMILNDDFLRIIIKQRSYQRCSENYIDNTIANLKSSNSADVLCATYMTNKSISECHNIENNFGILMINPTIATDRRYLFKGDGFILDKEKQYPQRYVAFKEKLSHPCNSLIIIDPYLLKKREANEDGNVIYPGIVNNLESLLDAILPQKLEVDFYLTIVSCLGDPKDIKRVYEKIKKCLKRIRRELNIKLGLFYTELGYYFKTESFHSRHVLSNTFVIDSEDGLDLFNAKGFITKNNPLISIVYPRMFGNSRQDVTKYYKWISSVKKYIEDCSYSCGDKGNRLFELVDTD